MDIHFVPSLVIGTSRLGAGDQDAAVETATAMLRSGLLIDTSNNYADGASERTLGIALAGLPPAEREDAATRILTKVDRDPTTDAFDGDRVLRSAEESLERLGVDHLPLLHLHDPYTVSVREALGAGGAVGSLLRLKEEGIVDAIGVAAGPVPLLSRYVESGAFDAVLCHNRWTLVDHSAESLFVAAKERGMTVFNAAPFGGDLLVRGPRPEARYGYRPIDPALAAWTTSFFALCERHGVAPAAVALRFSTRSPLIDHTVVGISSPQRMSELLALDAAVIPEALWQEIASIGPAPTPIDDPEEPAAGPADPERPGSADPDPTASDRGARS